MREVLIALDEQIFKNRNFGEVKLVPKETVTRRRILTADFIIENLPMRWYRVWVEEEQKFIPFCPLRIVLGLNKFQRNSQNLIERIWSFLGKGKRRGDITDIFNSIGINFGERLVTSLLRKIDLDNQEVKPVKIKQLFITADEATTPCRVENRKVEPITTRIACFYELHKNNKITFKDAYFRDYRKGEKRNLDEWTEEVKNDIKKKFILLNQKIIVKSDGAPWIKKFAKAINAKWMLDRFHCNRYLNWDYDHLPPKKRKKYINQGIKLLDKGEITKLTEILNQDALTSKRKVQKKQFKSSSNYFTRNAEGIINLKGNNFGSPESDVFKVVKFNVGNGNRIFGLESFKRLKQLRIIYFQKEAKQRKRKRA